MKKLKHIVWNVLIQLLNHVHIRQKGDRLDSAQTYKKCNGITILQNLDQKKTYKNIQNLLGLVKNKLFFWMIR